MNAANRNRGLVALSGATGHLGANLVRTLIAAGRPVRALYRSDRRALEGLDLETVQGDLGDDACLDRLASGADCVVHAAAAISVHPGRDEEVLRSNLAGTAALLAAARRAGVRRFVHISSTHAVRGEPFGEPFFEDRPYKGADSPAYDRSKAMAEQAALAEAARGGMEVVALRPSSMLGPWDLKPSLLGQAMLDLAAGRIPALVAGGYDFVDVRDVADAAVAALTEGASGEVYNVTGAYHDLAEFSRQVGLAAGVRTPSLMLPWRLVYGVAPLAEAWARLRRKQARFSRETLLALREGHPDMRHDKAARDLGYRPRPLSESVAAFFAWRAEQAAAPGGGTGAGAPASPNHAAGAAQAAAPQGGADHATR